MQGLAAELIAGLTKDKEPATLKQYFINQYGEKYSLSGRMAEIPRFEGKAGTPKRSRKGRTYRAPNGTRKYVQVSQDMVAYKV